MELKSVRFDSIFFSKGIFLAAEPTRIRSILLEKVTLNNYKSHPNQPTTDAIFINMILASESLTEISITDSFFNNISLNYGSLISGVNAPIIITNTQFENIRIETNNNWSSQIFYLESGPLTLLNNTLKNISLWGNYSAGFKFEKGSYLADANILTFESIQLVTGKMFDLAEEVTHIPIEKGIPKVFLLEILERDR